MSLERIESLRKEAVENPTKENYRALLLERAEFLKNKEQCQQKSGSVGDLGTSGPLSTPNSQHAVVWKHLSSYNRIMKECATRSKLLEYFMLDPYQRPEAYCAHLGKWLDEWSSFFTEVENDIRQMKLFARENPGQIPSMNGLYEEIDNLCSQQLRARNIIGFLRHRLAGAGELAVQAFMDHAESLELWLSNATQRESLTTTLRESENFFSYLLRNRNRVEEGLLALTFEAEVLQQSKDKERVNNILIHCFELWVELTRKIYEKLHCETIRFLDQLHLADACEKFIENEGAALKRWWDSRVLKSQNASDEARKEVMELQRAHDHTLLLASHLKDFKQRDKKVHQAFKCLANSTCIPMTYFCLHLPCYEEYEGRTEHHQRLFQLEEWIEAHSQGKTFMNLLERTKGLREMVEAYERVVRGRIRESS